MFHIQLFNRQFQPGNVSVYMDVSLLLLFNRRRVLVGLVFGVVWSGLLMFNCILQEIVIVLNNVLVILQKPIIKK